MVHCKLSGSRNKHGTFKNGLASSVNIRSWNNSWENHFNPTWKSRTVFEKLLNKRPEKTSLNKFFICQMYRHTQSWVKIDVFFGNLPHTSQTWGKYIYTKIPFIQRYKMLPTDMFLIILKRKKNLHKKLYGKTEVDLYKIVITFALKNFNNCKNIRSINPPYHSVFQVTLEIMNFRLSRTT